MTSRTNGRTGLLLSLEKHHDRLRHHTAGDENTRRLCSDIDGAMFVIESLRARIEELNEQLADANKTTNKDV